MSAQLKKGVLDLCVLNIVMNEDSYGYDIYQNINEDLSISESTIYPILRKLVKEGFCETYLAESNEGPPRKYFKITELGEAKLKNLRNEWNGFYQTVNRMIGSEK
jgi:PadR family transcriptional regulator PadR